MLRYVLDFVHVSWKLCLVSTNLNFFPHKTIKFMRVFLKIKIFRFQTCMHLVLITWKPIWFDASDNNNHFTTNFWVETGFYYLFMHQVLILSKVIVFVSRCNWTLDRFSFETSDSWSGYKILLKEKT